MCCILSPVNLRVKACVGFMKAQTSSTVYRCFCCITEAEAHPVGLSHAVPVEDEETQEQDTVLPSGCFISMVTGL